MVSASDFLRIGASVYFVGIKGTGVCALVELMHAKGVAISGSDIGEVFYTDAILQGLGISYHECFDPAHITDSIDVVIHSAAYSIENNVELAEASRKSIPIVPYPTALGLYSAAFDSTSIAGVHGKTTTTAMCGCLMRSLDLPAQILAGSAVANFDGKSVLVQGDTYFIAETCEYRSHFLAFHPKRVVLTAVESDHQDYFPTYESIRDAFVEYCRRIPPGGELIYCADDPGASEVADIIAKDACGISLVPYGFSAEGDFRVSGYCVEHDSARFSINAFPREIRLHVPGRHQVLNAAAAIALSSILLKKEFADNKTKDAIWNDCRQLFVTNALGEFKGSKRRSELIGNANGILFMDDYGHHPTAIKTTLEGLKDFFPSRRLVVSFMSHTYTRTAALLDEFARSLAVADVLFLHKIYASARERFDGNVSGMSIFEKVRSLGSCEVHYVEEPLDAFMPLTQELKQGDLFLTLGAGNNWPLGLQLFEHFSKVSA